MKAAFVLSVLASAVFAAEELKIDVTHKVECERKTQKGDKVSMHYLGTLQESGKKFDASAFFSNLPYELSVIFTANWLRRLRPQPALHLRARHRPGH